MTLAVTSLLVAAFALPLAMLVRDVARDRAITDAERDLAALAPVLSVTQEVPLVEAAIERTVAGANGRMALWLPTGSVVGDGSGDDPASIELARERRLAFSRSRAGGMDVYSPVVLEGDSVAVLRVRVPDAILRDGVAASWSILVALAVGLVALAVAATDRLGRTVTRPATDLATTSRSIAGGDLSARAQVAGPPEIAEAGAALNTLADRIEELLAAERERVADLSHRLRTPLTALRLSVERQDAPELSNDVDRLEREITEVIAAARRPLRPSSERRADLAIVTDDRARFWGALADDDGRPWSCTVDPGSPLVVELSEADAAAAVDALIGNVFAHTPERTGYAIAVRRSAARAVLTIDDAGPGVESLPEMLARGVSAAGSTGLGLDIASKAAALAGGELRAERLPRGGLRVVIDLPIVSPGGDP